MMQATDAPDPTLEAVGSFEDPSQWDLVKRRVPIFTPHEVEVEEGGKRRIVRVDEARLKRIAEKARELWLKKGVAIKFLEGHTLLPPGKVPQKLQPQILSYGINPEFGYWGPGRTPGVLVDQYVVKGCLPRVREYPFRSAEFYDDTDEITGVALLRTDPKLDMGMIFYGKSPATAYAKNGRRVTCYMENPMPDNDPTMPADAAQKDPMDGVPEDFRKNADMYMSESYPHMRKYHDEVCATKYGAGMGAEGGTLPVPVGEDKDKLAAPYGRDNLPAQYQRELTESKRELEVYKDLAKLQLSTGAKFDLDREVQYCRSMTPQHYERHKELLVQLAAPTGPGLPPTAVEAPKNPGDLDRARAEHHDKAMQYMRAHPGMQYEEALAKTAK